ncbi:hypothetical protein AYO22_03517 [Fonsecaea multimorphosa]|nr:hypothetical protein AYO22_03517 [Fonsecaea multimorphosa]
MPKKAKTEPKGPPCSHTYDATKTIPVDIDIAVATLADAHVVLQDHADHLLIHGYLKLSTQYSSNPVQDPSATGRKVNRVEQVDLAIEKIFHTSDWKGGRPLQPMIDVLQDEYTRKWGGTNAVYHDLARTYPEHREEIADKRGKHFGASILIQDLQTHCVDLRRFARRLDSYSVRQPASTSIAPPTAMAVRFD